MWFLFAERAPSDTKFLKFALRSRQSIRRRPCDASYRDASYRDASYRDASHRDASHRGASHRDAGHHDAGPHDAGPHDAGPHVAGRRIMSLAASAAPPVMSAQAIAIVQVACANPAPISTAVDRSGAA